MRARLLFRSLITIALCAPASLVAQATAATQSSRTIPAAFGALSAPIGKELSGDKARSTVAFVEQFFRLPGNRGFDASIDTVAALLRAAGYVPEATAKATDRLTFRVESRPMTAPAWTPDDASLTIVGRRAPLESWATNHNMLAINSWSTPDGGVTAKLIDVGAGTDADLAKQDLTGAIILIDGNYRAALPKALQKGARGALAVQKLPAYNQQSKNPTAIQFTSITRDTVNRGFVIFVSSAARDSLKAALAAGVVQVNAVVKARFE